MLMIPFFLLLYYSIPRLLALMLPPAFAYAIHNSKEYVSICHSFQKSHQYSFETFWTLLSYQNKIFDALGTTTSVSYDIYTSLKISPIPFQKFSPPAVMINDMSKSCVFFIYFCTFFRN